MSEQEIKTRKTSDIVLILQLEAIQYGEAEELEEMEHHRRLMVAASNELYERAAKGVF